MRQVYIVHSGMEVTVVEDKETVKEMQRKFACTVVEAPFFSSHKENEALINQVIHLKNRITGYKGAITKLKKYKRLWEDSLVP